ncbi:unannotated protein [freshwater metagenome]|uniref:Unannotated protein n=1 Tax=freshwater metagenome TaxID=449393 RepID=A0A6J7CI53_9ZZZZ|nr:hypothetical protein [Actinomycetota bacterium]
MMRPRGLIAALTAFATLVVAGPSAGASPVNTGTLHIYVPGSFAGCTATSVNSSPALRSIMDLIRPSAFLPNSVGRLIGVRGPILSAELTSLKPQAVVYTIDRTFHWSNGDTFSVADLTNVIVEGRQSSATWADGYHHIVSFAIGPKKNTLRVVFDNHYSDWSRMFRSLEHAPVPRQCRFDQIVSQPSLGPYTLLSLTRAVAVLQANESWPHYEQLYRTVIVEAGAPATRIGATPFVDLRYGFTRQDLTASSIHTDRYAKIGVSNHTAVVLYSPRRYLSSQLKVREYLSAALNRQELINQLIGEQTFAIAPARFNLIGQAQIGYIGDGGLSPVTQMTVPDSSDLQFTGTGDCRSCASALLNHGFGLRIRSGGVIFNGLPLVVRLAVGPSPKMRELAALIQSQWRMAGVSSFIARYDTELAAANAVAYGAAETALVEQTVGPVGSTAAAWYGPRRSDQFDAGWRSPQANSAALAALSAFNPVEALTSWKSLDQIIASNFWMRPLFAMPYYLRWSSSISTVSPSNSLEGLLCQLTLWNAT